MPDRSQYSVPDMSCQHCIDAITKHVSTVEGVIAVEIDLEEKTVVVEGGTPEAIFDAIDEAGYDIA